MMWETEQKIYAEKPQTAQPFPLELTSLFDSADIIDSRGKQQQLFLLHFKTVFIPLGSASEKKNLHVHFYSLEFNCLINKLD